MFDANAIIHIHILFDIIIFHYIQKAANLKGEILKSSKKFQATAFSQSEYAIA